MKWITYASYLIFSLLAQTAIAAIPVTMSDASPAIANSYTIGNTNTFIYTITNNVPGRSFPISVGGISAPVSRTTVLNDCGSNLPKGPSTCNIGVAIAPTAANVGQAIKQTLAVNYQGRTPLTKSIAFSVPGAVITTTLSSSTAATNSTFSITYTQNGTGGNVVSATLPAGMSFVGPSTCSISQAARLCSLQVNTGSSAGSYPIIPMLISGSASLLSSPSPLVITLNLTQYGYVGDSISKHIYQCVVNANGGDFSNCGITPTNGIPFQSPFSVAYAIVFTTVNGTRYGYVTDTDAGAAYQCTLNANGTFNICGPTPTVGAPGWVPQGLTFATVNGTQYAYVADINGNMYQCTLNTNGSFNTCNITNGGMTPSTWSPSVSAFVTINGVQYGYVADAFNGAIDQCTLNPDGTFNVCTPTYSGLGDPEALTFATFNNILYAYVGAAANHKLYQCTLNSNGSFNACTLTPGSGAPSWQPYGIAFGFSNGTQYAYVTGSNDPHLYQCTLNTNGSFGACNITPTTNAPNWKLLGIALASF
ncbi:MAG: hypothetical protein P4M14_07490 [Gammaproteobacteria bacterium]|nr:hypothetical protein [Gammaproteobacteria bacterium]